MPAGENPVAPDDQSVGIVIQVQGGHGRPADGGLADDPDSIWGPGEVLEPRMPTRVEEGYFHTLFGISGGRDPL